MADSNEELLEMAIELDNMDRDVNSWEAGFLESVLRILRDNNDLTDKQEIKLREMYLKYFDEDGGDLISPDGE